MGRTNISWADKVWNPITGCTKVSEGCRHCYAERMARRLRGRYGYPSDQPFRPTFHPDRLSEPLRWKKPRVIFVCSMADPFHSSIVPETICQVLAVIALCARHRFVILTKRPERMRRCLESIDRDPAAILSGAAMEAFGKEAAAQVANAITGDPAAEQRVGWPMRNLCVGISAEDQNAADLRALDLIFTPAAFRCASLEPLLAPINLAGWLEAGTMCVNCGDLSGFGTCCGEQHRVSIPGLDWIIVGGESGPGARPMKAEWAGKLRDQCALAGVSFFYKQRSGPVPGLEPVLDGTAWKEMPTW